MFHHSINKGLAIACLLAVFSLTFIASAHRPDFRVTEAVLKADDARMSGPCPMKVVFSGYITANGPGTFKYPFTRSDGATGPAYAMEFKQGGRQAVSTAWTLGDASVLPHFEGWQAIRILWPNSYESNKAKFEIDCQPGKEKQPGAQPTDNGKDKRAETYQKELPNLATPQKRTFDQEMSRLKAFAEKFQPDLAEAQRKLGFDSKAMNAEFRAITEEPDAAKRSQRSAEFQTKYEPQFIKLAQTAGIDLAAQRQQIITLLDLSKARVKESKTLAIIETADEPTPTPTPPPPDVIERVLSAPYTSAGTSGDETHANAATGDLDLFNNVIYAGSVQNIAFISQTLPVERGIRRLRVSATLDPVSYYVSGLSVLAGYSSSEAIVNLRVMEGSRVV